MRVWLPPLRAGELISSLISRAAQWHGVQERKVAQWLTGRANVCHPQNPRQLPEVSASLGVKSVEELICGNTTFLLTAPFFEAGQQTLLLQWLRGEPLAKRWRGLRSPDTMFVKYRFCPKCAVEQRMSDTGENSWLISWQIPANTLCLKHGCPLLELEESFRDVWGVQRLINPNRAMNSQKAAPLKQDRHAELIARTVEGLLNARRTLPQELPNQERLLKYYERRGLAAAAHGMRDYWGEDWLEARGIRTPEDLLRGTRARSWLAHLILLKAMEPEREMPEFLWSEELKSL